MKIWTTLLMVVALWMVFVSPGRCATDLPILLPLAQQQITEEFGRLDGGLKGAAEQLRVTGLTGEKARAILNNLCGDFSYAVDCTAVDARDRMVAVEPVPFRYLEGSDISWQEQVIGVQKSRKPVPSAVFRSVEGFDAADAEYPVIAPDGRFIGSVSLLFKPETFLENILHPLVRGLPVDIWVMEPGGRILFDSDRSQVGLNLFTSLRY